MSIRLLLSVTALFFTSISIAQLSTVVYFGAGPGKDLNSNSEYVSKVIESKDFIVKPASQRMTYAGGISVYHTLPSHFFMGGELQYQTSSTEYGFWDISGDSEFRPSMTLVESEHRIALPVFVGAHLWHFSLSSGVSVNMIVSKSSELDQLESFSDNDSKFYMGWHVGLGYHLGPVELEARYIQDFKNYGSGYELADKDMVFYGNRSRVVFLVKYNLLHWRG